MRSKNVELAKYLVDKGATFGQGIEDMYNLFKQRFEDIRQQLQEYIEDDARLYFPNFNVMYFNEILSLENIPGKYDFFKSFEFKEKLLNDVINRLTEDSCEYKGKLLFYMKDVDHIQTKVRNNLRLLRYIKL